MLVDLWGEMLLIHARKDEWNKFQSQLKNLKIYKADYDKRSDRVNLVAQDAIVTASLEGEDEVYAIAYPVLYRHLEPFITEMGERLRERLESYRNIKVKNHGYQLRDYQVEAVKKFLEKRAATVALPTGAGKTVIALEAIRRVAKRTLILVPTKVLAEQWKQRLEKYVDVGIYPDGKDADVVIATYQSFRHYSDFKDFYFLVADEGHHLPAAKWWNIVKYNLFPARLVLSATPERSDNNHEILLWWTLSNIYKKTYSELMERGYLARLELNVVWVNLKFERKVHELESLYKSIRGVSEKTAKVKMTMKKVVLNDPAKIEAVRFLVNLHKDDKVIIFVPYVHTAKLVYEALYNDYHPAVLVGQGREAEFPGALTINDFRESRTKVLIATPAGEEGIDIPDASVEIMMDAPSVRQLVQRIGRVARPKPQPARVYFVFAKGVMLDISNWKKVKNALITAGIDVRPKHYEFKSSDNGLEEPEFN